MGLLAQDEKGKEKFFRLLHVSEVYRLLEILRQQSARTPVHDTLQHRHHTQRLELLLAHLWFRLEGLDRRTADCALEIYGRAGAVEAAEWIFQRYLECGAEPRTDTYNKLMTVYLNHIKQNGDEEDEKRKIYMERLEGIWEKVRLAPDGPDAYSYNILLSAKVKTGDIEGAERVFEEMMVQPDRVSYHILLDGYLKALEHSQQQQAELWLGKMMKHGIQPDTKTFNTLMSGMVRQMRRSYPRQDNANAGTLEATASTIFKLAEAMEKLGVEKDTHSIGILIHCYFLCGEIEQIDKLSRELGILKSGCHDTTTVRSKLVAGKHIYNSLINIYLTIGQDEKAMEIYHDMTCKGKHADVITYGTLIRHSLKRSNLQGAISYYQMMEKAGIQGNSRIRNMLLSATSKEEEHDKTKPHGVASAQLSANTEMSANAEMSGKPEMSASTHLLANSQAFSEVSDNTPDRATDRDTEPAAETANMNSAHK
jgi:pentatricopeptide repeat protein